MFSPLYISPPFSRSNLEQDTGLNLIIVQCERVTRERLRSRLHDASHPRRDIKNQQEPCVTTGSVAAPYTWIEIQCTACAGSNIVKYILIRSAQPVIYIHRQAVFLDFINSFTAVLAKERGIEIETLPGNRTDK